MAHPLEKLGFCLIGCICPFCCPQKLCFIFFFLFLLLFAVCLIGSVYPEPEDTEYQKIKENNLLQAAFNLFTKEDITNVSVNDIVKSAGVAKGTFYLYFKDKYQIRDILIQKEAHRLFEEAHKQLEKNDIRNFEDSVIFLINQVLIRLENNPLILKFVERNLSWGVFHAQLNTAIDNDSFNLIKEFNEIATANGYEFENSEVILYLIVELTGSTCYNSILHSQPLPIEEYKPILFDSIRAILSQGKKKS